jgi:hypothetical protein
LYLHTIYINKYQEQFGFPHYTKIIEHLFFSCGEFTCGEQVDSVKHPLRAQAMLNENFLTCRLYLHLRL